MVFRAFVDQLPKLDVGGAPCAPPLSDRRHRLRASRPAGAGPRRGRFGRPALDFEVRQPSAQSRRDLESGALDLLLMPQEASGPGVVWTVLHDDGYTCVVWRKHPCRRQTPARFAGLEHVFVAPGERSGGVVDTILAERQLARRVAVQVPSFLIVPYLLIGTERIATVPMRMGPGARARASTQDPHATGRHSPLYDVPGLARAPSSQPRPPLAPGRNPPGGGGSASAASEAVERGRVPPTPPPATLRRTPTSTRGQRMQGRVLLSDAQRLFTSRCCAAR